MDLWKRDRIASSKNPYHKRLYMTHYFSVGLSYFDGKHGGDYGVQGRCEASKCESDFTK